MSLPKFNNSPKYDLSIPSLGKKVKFRPYLVKEEKVLMMAMESQDKTAILNAIVDTIIACVDEDVDRSKLTIFDLEYMFIKIRSKSVGEKSTIGIKCLSEECSTLNEVQISLDDVEIDEIDAHAEIAISDGMTLKMTYPNFSDMIHIEESTVTETEKTFLLMAKCIDQVITEEEIHKTRDEPESEVLEFIESFSGAQFTKLKNYVENIPRVRKEVDFECKKCSKNNSVSLRGIDDFF
jgi:hypothetical protein